MQIEVEKDSPSLLASSINILRYKDIWDFYRQHSFIPRRTKFSGQHWRLADQTIGWPNGLPGLMGVAVATDGVILLVRRYDESIVECHLKDWVVQDSIDRVSKSSKPPSAARTTDKDNFKKVKMDKQLDDFLKEMELL